MPLGNCYIIKGACIGLLLIDQKYVSYFKFFMFGLSYSAVRNPAASDKINEKRQRNPSFYILAQMSAKYPNQ